jgi:hypothetical protein
VKTLLVEILAAWRRAERLTNTLEPGTPDHAAAQNACERLRDLYHDLARSGMDSEHTREEAVALLEKFLAD